MECEVYAGKASAKAQRILGAMCVAAESAGVTIKRTEKYQGLCRWYMTWGLGHPIRREWTNEHLSNGGRVIGWDLGYWDRFYRFRVTIDHDHPYRLVRDMPHTRLPKVKLRSDYREDGPVLVIGMGPKSKIEHGDWQRRALRKTRLAYPDREIILREKRDPKPIEKALKGASLVVCRHSNVAIDACIAGVPVVCEDGIARSLYGSKITKPLFPTVEQRTQLLANAGWWQWRPCEAKQAWEFLKSHIR